VDGGIGIGGEAGKVENVGGNRWRSEEVEGCGWVRRGVGKGGEEGVGGVRRSGNVR